MESTESKITEIIDMGDGTRAEIDLIDILDSDEGILVGNTGEGFLLVLAETRFTDTYPPRPFRVNVGAIHQYIYLGNNVTKYISEVEPGDKVIVTNGISERQVTVGRVKIEKRPIRRIQLENNISASLQIADSIFLCGKDTALHFVDLNSSDSVLCVPSKSTARHKGEIVDEFIVEK